MDDLLRELQDYRKTVADKGYKAIKDGKPKKAREYGFQVAGIDDCIELAKKQNTNE